MPSLADYLNSQDSLNGQAGALMPAVGPQLAPDLAQRSAQSIMATTPQMTRQAQSAAMGGLTPSSMRSMMAPRGGMTQANLDFSPVSSWSEGLSGGIGNAMAMLQANRANQAQQAQQNQLLDFYRQQQEAVLQQEQAKQQTEQAKIMGQAQVAQKLVPGMTLDQAIGFVQSTEGAKVFGAYQALADQVVQGQQKDIYGQQALEILPTIGQANQPIPISPMQQQQLNIIGGAPAAAFNQYTPQQNYIDTQQKINTANKTAQEVSQAHAMQPVELKAKAVGIQGSELDNAKKQFENSVAPINQQIKELEAQGKIDEAAQKRADLEMGRQLLDATLGNLDNLTPAQRAGVTARLKGMGLNVDIPDVSKPQVVGSGKEARVVAPNGQLVPFDQYNQLVQQPAVTVPQQVPQPTPQRTVPVTVKAPARPANKTTKTSKGIVVTSPKGQSITFGNNPKNW